MAKDHATVDMGVQQRTGVESSVSIARQDGNEDHNTPTQVVTREREAGWGDYFRVFTYAKPSDFALMVAAAVASLGLGVTNPVMNVVFGKVINKFTGYGATSSITEGQFRSTINTLCLYYVYLFIARLVLSYICKFCLRIIGLRISAAIRMHYLRSLLDQTVHVLDTMPPGAAAAAITSEADILQIGISEKLGAIVESISSLIAATVIALFYSWRVTLVALCAITFSCCAVAVCLPLFLKCVRAAAQSEGQAGAVAAESFSAIRMIYACGAQDRMLKRYSRFSEEAKARALKGAPYSGVQWGLVFFGMNVNFALSFWYGTRVYVAGNLDGGIGAIVIVLLSVFQMGISVQKMVAPVDAASKAVVAAASFFAVIDAPKPDRGHLRDPDVAADGDITFEGVTFAYPGRPTAKVLDDLHLTIEAGKILAIVGPSGSGKSTIVGLIEKWYSLREQAVIQKAIAKKKEPKKKKKAETSEAQKPGIQQGDEQSTPTPPLNIVSDEQDAGPPVELKGRILTSGHSLDEIDVKWWRTQIGLVQQEPFLFNDTIYNNVMHGLVGTEWDDEPLPAKQERVKQACQEAFAEEFIVKLPQGYETVVGDSGSKLSGGQRQRLAIARSIIKKPKILILDEATSAVDVRSEKIIQAALDRVSRGRTTIVIAHRLSTISKADSIAVLSKGKLVEQGTHEDLLKNENGVYAGLVRAQGLTLGKETQDDDSSEEQDEIVEEDVKAFLAREKSAVTAIESLHETAVDSPWKNRGLAGSFGRLLWEQKSRFPSYVTLVICSAVIGTGTPLTAYFFGQVISAYQLPPGDLLLSRSRTWSLWWFILSVVTGLGYGASGLVSGLLHPFITNVYRQQYFQALIRQPISFFDAQEHSIGTLTAQAQSDPKQLEEMLGMNMCMVMFAVFQLTGALIIAFCFTWKLACLATFVTIPIGVACVWYRFTLEKQFERLTQAVFAESSQWAAEAIGAFRSVSSLTLEDKINARYEALLHEHVVSAYKKARFSTVIFALADSAVLACAALQFWYGGGLLANKEINVLAFFVCYMASTSASDAAGVGFSFGSNASLASAAANRILSIRERRGEHSAAEKVAEEAEGEVIAEKSIPESVGGVKIEFKDVSFKYPTRDVRVFKNLNITVEKGQFAALVGASGSGKSSIVALLERFYEPQSGRILCNGKDIRNVNVYEHRKQLSLVAQEANLFQGTIKENILLGVSNADDDDGGVTDAQLHQACRDASIHDFIVSLPDGYNTDVGSRGVALSGGQKQRLAIARAIIRDPQVLLLDEATSALDSESEKQITAALNRAAKGRTTLAVAHRLSTIQHADVIYVLGEGAVLEMGTHAELLKQRGVYFSMCQSQALEK